MHHNTRGIPNFNSLLSILTLISLISDTMSMAYVCQYSSRNLAVAPLTWHHSLSTLKKVLFGDYTYEMSCLQQFNDCG